MTGQLNFDLRRRATAAAGGRSDPGATGAAQDRAAKIRAARAVNRRKRTPQEERWVKDLISSIRRMWRKPGTPDAPPNPPMKPGGIRERAYRSANSHA